MTVQGVQFFMKSAEFEVLISEIVRELNTSIVLVRQGIYQQVEMAIEGLVMSDTQLADRIFLATEKPATTELERAVENPAKQGWVMCDVPREQNNTLFIAHLAAKSDWYDEEEQNIKSNPTSIKLFRRIKPYFLKHLKFPIWAFNIHNVNQLTVYHNIGYSESVRDWVESGGKLMQAGVANVRFSLSN